MQVKKSTEDVKVFPHAPVQGNKIMYSPNSGVEYLAALYSTWNILDAIMMQYNYGCNDKSPASHPKSSCKGLHDRFNPFAFGYMRPEQAKVYAGYLSNYGGKNTSDVLYCEIGTNGGHSSVMALLANARLRLVSFDMHEWTYTKEVSKFLNMTYQGRYLSIPGSSFETVPQFFGSKNDKCNVALVDGLHTTAGAALDLQNLYDGMTCEHHIFIDDLQSPAGKAVTNLRSEGKIEIIEQHDYPAHSEQACLRRIFPKDNHKDKRKWLTYEDVQNDHYIKYWCGDMPFSFAVARFVGGPYNNCTHVE